MLKLKPAYFFTACLLFFFFTTKAQVGYTDSLKLQLSGAKQDSTKIYLSYELSRIYLNSNFDSMLFYSNQAANLLKQVLPKETEDSSKLDLLWYISEVYRYVSIDSMVDYAQQALFFCREHKDKLPAKTEINSLLMLAGSLWWAGNYPDAKETFFDALQAAEPLHDNLLTGEIYNGIAMVNRNAGDNRQAINYYTKAETLVKHIPDNDVLFSLQVDKGKSYEQLGILDSAYTYVQEGLAMLKRKYPNNNLHSGGIYAEMGIIYSKMRKKKLAEEFFWQSIQFSKEANEVRLLARAYCEFAEHYDRFDQEDSAIIYATKALLIDRQFGLLVQLLQASTLLTKLYKDENKIDSAFKYQQLMVATRDSVFSREKMNRLQTLDFNEQLRQQEIEAIKKTSAQQRKQNLLLGGLLAVVLIAVILYRNNLQKQKAKTKIENAYSELKTTQAQLIQSEKMASLGELTAGIAHEIQNPLNFVNNFSEVSTELVDEMNTEIDKGNLQDAKEIANDLKQNLEKINHHGKRAGDIVKGMLAHSRTSSGQKELTDINALCDEYLRLSYHGLRAKDKTFNAKFETEFDNSIGKINVVPQDIGRVVLNLINNAFYAVNEKKKASTSSAGQATYEPAVTVATKQDKSKVLIVVKDNGAGIPQNVADKIFQPFFTTKPAGQGTGLGLSLSYDIVKAHGGELKVETKEKKGTIFIIELPVVL